MSTTKVLTISEPLRAVRTSFEYEGNVSEYSAGTFVVVFTTPLMDYLYIAVDIDDSTEIKKYVLTGYIFTGFGLVIEPNTVALFEYS